MANKKHYVIVSITLGAIAAASALLIGGANYLTNEKIKQNEINNINRGIDAIFGESAEIKDQKKSLMKVIDTSPITTRLEKKIVMRISVLLTAQPAQICMERFRF